MTTRPEMKFRAGAITASIWKNISTLKDAAEAEYHTVSFERVYKDKKGEWQSTASLRVNDLPKAQVVLGKAYEYLVLRHNEPAQEAVAYAA